MIKFEEYFNILNESVSRTNRYINMFLIAFKVTPSPDLEKILFNHLKDDVIPILKRDDIIQWYCRLLCLDILINIDLYYKGSLRRSSALKEPQEPIEKYSNQIDNRLKIFKYSSRGDFKNDLRGGDIKHNLLSHLNHFLSLGISKIDNYRFYNQKMSDVISQFREWEYEWQKEAKTSFDDTEEHPTQTVLKKYPNGFEWVSLNKTYCQKEGSAMGHCGNRPSARQGDNVISLRKVEMHGKQRFVRPSLTFIYNSIDNEFGEMKGRANEKPNQKYHGYIVDLLLMKDKTGNFLFKKLNPNYGYMIEKNFRISDLDKRHLEIIKDQRPDLFSTND